MRCENDYEKFESQVDRVRCLIKCFGKKFAGKGLCANNIILFFKVKS